MKSHRVTVAILIGAVIAYWFGFGIMGAVALGIGIGLELWFYIRVLPRRGR